MAGALAAILITVGAALRAADADVQVILWFDTEDYLLPASDDAAKRVAEILSERGIRGTFKIVGEKARVLERRGRRDVIDALRRHDLGYHTNLHSVHPTPAEYLADMGWLEGIAEFVRRERGGAGDVRRIFGVERLSTYGQPGSSWTPHAVAALPEIGVMTVGFVAHAITEARVPERVVVEATFGPSEPPPVTAIRELAWPAYRDAVVDAAAGLRSRQQVPSRLFAGPAAMAPADFLRATAPVALAIARGPGHAPAFPERVTVPAGTPVGTARLVADDTATLFGGWIIHPENFHAPHIVRLAKLQAWTLKPADSFAEDDD